MEIFTLGHSLRSEADFSTILVDHRIAYLADLRRFPGERKNPGHGIETLEKTCLKLGITHIAMGRTLGGGRPEGYREYMETETFHEGMDELLDLAKRKPTVMLCREAFYFRCHRKYIADEFTRQGWTVQHLLDARRVLTHQTGAYRQNQKADLSE